MTTTKFFSRYFVLIAATLAMFLNFIACGAQMYQVSMEEDFPEDKISEEAKDPSSPIYGIHSTEGWVDLPIKFKLSSTLSKDQEQGLINAMKTWEDAVGKQLFDYLGVDERGGDSFPDLYSSLTDFVNGHYKDFDWDKTGKDQIVLATTIWDNLSSNPSAIATADIRYNSQYYLIGDSMKLTAEPTREVVDMESLALHELGHLLGLAHISETKDPYSIMNPSLFIGEGLSTRRVSRGDIIRIQQIYGCLGEACDVDKMVERFEMKLVSAPKGESATKGEEAH